LVTLMKLYLDLTKAEQLELAMHMVVIRTLRTQLGYTGEHICDFHLINEALIDVHVSLNSELANRSKQTRLAH